MIINFSNLGGGSGSGGSSTWGQITGTITDQTDLITYIDERIGDVETIINEMLNSVGE